MLSKMHQHQLVGDCCECTINANFFNIYGEITSLPISHDFSSFCMLTKQSNVTKSQLLLLFDLNIIITGQYSTLIHIFISVNRYYYCIFSMICVDLFNAVSLFPIIQILKSNFDNFLA